MGDISNLKIFAGIDKEIVKNIIDSLEKETYLEGQIILNKGDESNGKGYIIISGGVDVFIDSEKIASLGAGDVFGEIALLNEEERTATIIANSALETLVITQDSILQIMNEDNTLNKEIMRRVQENTLK